MPMKLRVLVSGRNKADLERLAAPLRGCSWIDLTVRCQTNGHTDPLHQVSPMPDVLVLVLSGQWEHELGALEERPAAQRPTLLAIGADSDARIMRKAMRAGARDLLIEPFQHDDLLGGLEKIAREGATGSGSASSRMLAVVSAKGGTGGSIIATSIGHILAARLQSGVCVMDMDMQFGTVPLYLNLQPQHGLRETLTSTNSLDSDALRGFMTRHPSGLHVLASLPGDLVLPGEVSGNKLAHMLDVAKRTYEHVVLDLPSVVDSSWTTAMGKADQVLLVLQQSVAHVRNAKQLMHILRQEIGLSHEQIVVIVNRYSPRSRIGLKDIADALDSDSPFLIPNDYALMSESGNLGSPPYELKKNASTTKALFELASQLSVRPLTGPGLIRRAVSSLVGIPQTTR